MNFPLFGEEGADAFDVLDLRTAQNYSWSSSGSSENTFVREVWSRDLQRDMHHPYTRSRYHHLYVNGQYFGLFQTQERVEEFYAETYLGGNEDDYDIVKSGLRETGGPTEISEGTEDAWRAVFDLGQDLWDNPTANADNYFTLQGLNPDGTRNPSLPVLLDVDNLIDWMIGIAFTGNRDSGLSDFIGNNVGNNWFGIRNRETMDQGFVFFAHDAEHSLGAAGTDLNDRTGPFFTDNQDDFAYSNPQYLHQDLMASPEYRLRFADRIRKHFFSDGALTEQNNLDRLNARVAVVDSVIIAEAARWGDAKVDPPRDKFDWQNEINTIINGFFPIRNSLVLDQFENDDLWFDDLIAPSMFPLGGSIPAGSSVFIIGTSDFYFTTDGSDPRLPGGAINPNATLYTEPVELNADTNLRARGYDAGDWSPLTEAQFTMSGIPAFASALQVTEVHYNPLPPTPSELALAPGTTAGDYEFIEFTNVSPITLDLGGVEIVEGIDFTFSQQSLAPGQSVVVASNPTAFQARYGSGANVVGPFFNSLSNGGELLQIDAADGSLLQAFTYSDDDDWPTYPDGYGQSLWVIDPAGDYNDPLNWLPSKDIHGSPGVRETPQASNADLRITEIHYNPGTAGSEFVEFTNYGSSAIDLTPFEVIEGIQIDFDASPLIFLSPGESAVVVGDLTEFENYLWFGTSRHRHVHIQPLQWGRTTDRGRWPAGCAARFCL